MTHTDESMVELGRLNALSDGVFAIALTILVLNIRIPDSALAGELSASLLELTPQLLIYLISFIVIGGAWGSHQRMLSQIRRGDGVLVWLNLLSLLFVTLVPASAALLGRFPREFVAIVCFAADVILIQLTTLWLWRHASRYGLLNPSLDPRVVRSIGRRLILSAVSFGLSVALIVFSATLVYVGWIGLFALLFTTDWLSWQQVTKTTQIAVPLDGATRGHIEMQHGLGRLTIQSDAAEETLVQGTGEGDFVPRVTRDGDLLKTRLALYPGWGFLGWRYPWAWDVPALDWDLSVNSRIPLALQIEAGVSEIDLDLTKTLLTDLNLTTGNCTIALRLPAKAGQTAVHVRGIASLAIHVPPKVAARIHAIAWQGTEEASLEVDLTRFPLVADGQEYEYQKEYRSSGYDTAANRVDIHLERVLGSVKIS